ncbi:hypothetical protein BDV28DRAFT_110844 [Aspergillus coremiiformis]|uniref:Uncharacterized protein n=1 Tax=Aspergillus coremiiformis TaxID=138285 RepID=A0A5N6ZGR0_9EURO|nr:hypothetical protein BDV28DRAFT_110844 [Aspergillus coremiiformis]
MQMNVVYSIRSAFSPVGDNFRSEAVQVILYSSCEMIDGERSRKREILVYIYIYLQLVALIIWRGLCGGMLVISGCRNLVWDLPCFSDS